jgi:hypothetical protein
VLRNARIAISGYRRIDYLAYFGGTRASHHPAHTSSSGLGSTPSTEAGRGRASARASAPLRPEHWICAPARDRGASPDQASRIPPVRQCLPDHHGLDGMARVSGTPPPQVAPGSPQALP